MKYAFLFFLALVAGTLRVGAQSYGYLTLHQADGTEQSLAVNGLKITFADGNLVAVNKTEQVTIALTSLSKLYFAETPTGITEAAGQDALSVRIEGGTLRHNAPAGTSVTVYATDGRRMPATGLQPGLYIVRIAGQTYHVVSR